MDYLGAAGGEMIVLTLFVLSDYHRRTYVKWWHGWRESDHPECGGDSVRDLQGHLEEDPGHQAVQAHRSFGKL